MTKELEPKINSEMLAELDIYPKIRNTVEQAQKNMYAAVNFVMVETYWNIGKQICEAQGGNTRA
ncbi:MAG: hypothetical protein WAX04_10910 [Oscillospiraceae bacterium]